ncbi:MAG: hypothetical protein LQ347_000344 [Umbilicaria vellea]|nr:MAG: hypothetical protein LQ347_000344 [Umbilicaria vellea]
MHEAPIRRAGTGKQSQRKEASDVDDLVADFGFLAVNATARDFYGFTAEMSFARLVLSTSSKEAMPPFATNVLPPRYAATPLVQHYLDYVFILYPFLSEAALFASLDNLYQDAGRHATPMDHWTIRMVLAIALASRSRYNGDSQYRDAVRHAAAALEWGDRVLQPGSRVAIQALLLLVQYAMLDPFHFSSWYLIGVASRVMVDLGLHQDPPEELRMKDAHLTLRRRIYSSVYALDRLRITRHGISVWGRAANAT